LIDVKDRIVEHPHRYQLIPVSGETNTYDIIAKPGVVTEEGTPINKALFKSISDYPSFMAFAGNVNPDMLDAAFGKGNEDRITGIGRQLAMYAWFKGDSKSAYPFTSLLTCDTLADALLSCPLAREEVINNANCMAIISASPFALSTFNSLLTDSNTLKTYLANGIGHNPTDYASLNALLTNQTALSLIASNNTLMYDVARSTLALNIIMFNPSCVNTLYSKPSALTQLEDGGLLPTVFEGKTVTGTSNTFDPVMVYSGRSFVVKVGMTAINYGASIGNFVNSPTTVGYTNKSNIIINRFANSVEFKKWGVNGHLQTVTYYKF
jgi:hypothetical protein